MKLKRSSLILIVCFLAQGLILPASADDKNPKLVLQITVGTISLIWVLAYFCGLALAICSWSLAGLWSEVLYCIILILTEDYWQKFLAM